MPNPLQAFAAEIAAQTAGKFSQHRRVLRLVTPLDDHTLLAESLRGEEEIDKGFRFQVSALSLDDAIPLRSLIGQPVLVELQTAGAVPRPFHGHVTAAEMVGANGGFARYQLQIEPWTAFLALGRDSRVFQDKTVFEILETVFKSYDNKGRLAPAWRFDIRDRSVYPQHSLVTQYQESDLAFAERLMSEEGLFYFFEHQGDPDSSSLGSHMLVIADHNGAFEPNVQADVRFTRPGAAMKEDGLDRWRTEVRMQTNAIELVTWDYRACKQRLATSATYEQETLISRDFAGAYAYPSSEQGQRIADNQLQGLQARKKRFIGAGTVRTFAPGTRFTLHEHATYDGGDEASFTILRVCHVANNNLSADIGQAASRLLGCSTLQHANDADLATSLHRFGVGERPVYRNRIDAMQSRVDYRPSRIDGHGRLLHPRPLVRGQQTAVVVGPSGSVIHTDRDHRIKVQFHWQRGDVSHSRLPHPSPEGQTGAPANDQAGTWVRVATPLAPVAGANWGTHALPRVGQEVLVDFLDGDIDRPVVIGSLYNGRGQPDAQFNQVNQGAGSVTGNAPVWFPGESGAHAHSAALAGIKSQAMSASQDGAGAYSQLVFDDSRGQARVALQRHGKSHDGSAELNMGHLRHHSDNQRLDLVGFGAELKTDHNVALRAGEGLLLSTDARNGGKGNQLDAQEAAAQIEQSHQLQVELATLAQKHNTSLQGEPGPEKLAAVLQMANSAEVISSMDGGDPGQWGGGAEAVAFSEPQLQLSSPAGIVATTPESIILSARKTSSMSAGQDINLAAQGSTAFAVKDGISLFTYGKATNKDKPNQETGIKLHAASGTLSVQSQSDATRVTADKMIMVASITKTVAVTAKNHVLLTAQGAYVKLAGGNIEIHCPGKVEFKASKKELAGPQSTSARTSVPKPAQFRDCAQKLSAAAGWGSALVAL